MSQIQPLAVPRRRGVMRRRIIPGVGVALAVLGALELGLRIIAEGHPSQEVRMYALAFSVTAGAIVAGLRGATGAVLVLLIASGVSEAGDINRSYNVTIASSACPTGAPGLLSDGKAPGMSLAGVVAWNVTVCPEATRTFTGTGGWKVCVYREYPGPQKWATSNMYFDMTDDGRGNAIVTTTANPCHTFYDVEVGVADGDLVYVRPTQAGDTEGALGVSAGTAVSVYLEAVYKRAL
jgi:hypothetical protein